MELRIVVGTKIPADDNTGADRYAIEKQDQHVDDAGGGTNGGQSLAADKISDHKTVYRVIKLLEKVTEKQRNCKDDKMPDNGSGCHIDSLLFLM